MPDPLYRLADSTLIEPLVHNWPAWSHLLAPVAASFHLLNYQVAAMNSYLENPAFHHQASHDPDLIGGPFLDIAPERAEEVRALLAATEERQRPQLAFARAAAQLYDALVRDAKGQNLAPFYAHVPEQLRGFVELAYDYYDRPVVRFLDGLLFNSRDYYPRDIQSLRLSKLRTDARTFIMSTPRLRNDATEIDWPVAFDDPRVDKLYALDIDPRPLPYIRDLLGLGPADDSRLLPLLQRCDEPTQLPPVWDASAPRLRYFGHACVLIEWHGVAVLTDACVAPRPSDGGATRWSFRDLPEHIDYVLITHDHHDHFVLETLLRLRHRTRHLVVPQAAGILHGDISLGRLARRLGWSNVIEVSDLDRIDVPGGRIVAVPFLGEHADLLASKTGYVVQAGDERVYFGADADCPERKVYEIVRDALGPIETVFLGTESVGAPLSWTSGPLFPRRPPAQYDQTRRYHGADADAAMRILDALGATRVYNYAMGLEPWVEYLLGLGLTDASPQVQESDALLARARARSFHAAERLSGRREIQLGTDRDEGEI